MIITLIATALVVLGIIFFIIHCYNFEDWAVGGFIGSFLFGMPVFLICLCAIIKSHTFCDLTIESNRIKYESLLKRIEIVNSEYEDISKSDIVKDVADWNRSVLSKRYFSSSPWTNWFYSKEVVDNLECIDY